VTLTIPSTPGERHKARRAYLRFAGFLRGCVKLRSSWIPCSWYRILREVLKRYRKGVNAIRRCALRKPDVLAMVMRGTSS
jgi:hypothetical protein